MSLSPKSENFLLRLYIDIRQYLLDKLEDGRLSESFVNNIKKPYVEPRKAICDSRPKCWESSCSLFRVLDTEMSFSSRREVVVKRMTVNLFTIVE